MDRNDDINNDKNKKHDLENDLENGLENGTEQNKDGKQNSSMRSEIMSWVITIFCAIAFALIVNNFVIVNANVPTGSMLETIPIGSRNVAFRWAYAFSDPERFDVAVFVFPDDGETLYVKRIIGLPGETVEIKDGLVYINGSEEPLDDSFVVHKFYDYFGPVTVPEGHYFMMGDNRSDSWDSRYWTNTFVAKDKILGKAIFSYYPKIKLIK